MYILSNPGRTVLYIGVTAALRERITRHKLGEASDFTTKYNVVDLMYFEEFQDMTQAIFREKQLKNWHRDWKWNLIREKNPNLTDLYSSL